MNPYPFFLFLFTTLFNFVDASFVNHPDINFDPLQQLAISGSYTGISLYKDTQQLTALEKDTSSVISLSNDTLRLIASTNTHGTIYDSCIFNNTTLILAGNFTRINGKINNNIVSIDLTNNNVISLKHGLDGPVYSVYCDTNSIYAGGSFIAPSTSDMTAYSDSLSQFGGSVAEWNNNDWIGLPWKGLNGPVYSIVKNVKKNQLIFGGKFDTTTDGQTMHAPASQPISIPASGITATSGTNPAAILCASTSSSSPWLLSDGVTGTWQTSFINYQVNPSLVRIVNSKVENHQTKGFSIRSLTAGSGNYTLSYLDPVTGIASTCSNNCVLSNDPAVTFQDFRILNTSMTSGIAIDIKSWYGVGGGLSSVKVFQSEIFAYAVNPDSTNACQSASTTPKIVQSGGNWTTSSDKTSPYLTHAVKSKSDTASILFYPTIVESGIYELLIYTPPCLVSGCKERTDIDITITPSASVTANATMSQKYPGSIPIYSGYFDITSSFQPHIKFSLAKNATVSSATEMVAFAIQLVKSSTNSALSSILQFNQTQTNITMTNLAWGAFADNVPYNSVVKTMQSMDNGDLFIGGNFTGTDKSNAKYSHIVQFVSSANQLNSLNGGLNGMVETMTATASDIIVGGNFTGTSTTPLQNVAKYNTKTASWSALDQGVNGTIKAINQVSINTLLLSGEFNNVLSKTTPSFGNAWWDTQKEQWIIDNTIPFLSGTVSGAFTNNNKQYFVGQLGNAQRYRSNGLAYLSSGDQLEFPDFHPDGSSFVSSGVLFNSNSGVTTSSTVNSSTTAILGGSFNLPNNIQNIAIFANKTWSGVQGADWQQGQISCMAVNNDLLYVGGTFTGASSNNLAVFSLSNKSLSLNPSIKTNDGSPVNVNIIRHLPTQNAMVVGGNFSSVGSLACSSVCALNTVSLQWNSLGSGLVGEVYDMVMVNNKLVTTGNMTLNNAPLPIAQFDFDKNAWGPFATAELPGPSRAISYDNLTNYLYISGQTQDTSATYFRIWNGQQFNAPVNDLGPGSIINKLSMLPVRNTTAQNIVLASGFINLGSLGNVSAAFYDGKDWIPYFITTNANGESSTSLSSLFFLDPPYITAIIKHYMPTPLVILVAISVSLGIVFLIVLCTMIIIYMKRKHDAKVNPQTNPASYYGKSPRTPQSLLTMLDTTPVEGKSPTDYSNSTEKLHHLGPEAQQFYNMSKSISTDHLHEQPLTPFHQTSAITTARAAPLPPTAHSRSIPHPSPWNATVPVAAAAAVVANHPTNRPESYARPISEYQRNSESFYNNYNNSGREMAEVPGRKNSYNPFRSSEMNPTATGAFDASMTPHPVSYNQASGYADTQQFYHPAQSATPVPQQSQAVSYGNIPPANPSKVGLNSTALGVAGVAGVAMANSRNATHHNEQQDRDMYQSTPSPQNHANLSVVTPGTVKWTTSPSEPASYAVVKPVSMVGTSDESSLLDPISGPQVARANHLTPQSDSSFEKSSNLSKAAMIAAPAIAVHRASDTQPQNQSSLSLNKDIPQSNVRWTNYDDCNAIGVVTVEPGLRESAYNDHGSFYTADSPDHLDASSLSHHVYSTSDGFSSDPDIVRLTHPSTNSDPTEKSRSQYQPSLSITANPIDEEDDDLSTPRSYNDHVNTKVMHKNAFRLSDAGSLPPIDTQSLQENTNNRSNDDLLSPDSAVRWKNTNVGSPIETGFAAHVLEPAFATVTRREEDPFEKYTTKPSSEPSSAKNKYKPVVNPLQKSIETTKEPLGRKSETIEDAISNRDLDALSNIIQNEQVPVNPLEQTPIPTNSRSTPSPAGVDGRAASKRMVEEYLTSRNNKTEEVKDKKSKYKSDFKSIMESAISNNTKTEIATEDQPHLYYAKFDFSAREHGELGFEKADPIIVIDSSDDIWWMGYKADKSDGSFIQGVFPSNYAEIATELKN